MSRHPSGSDHTDADAATDDLVFVFFLDLVFVVVVFVFLAVDFDFVFLVLDGVDDVDDVSGVTGTVLLLLVPSLVVIVVVMVSVVEETPLLLRFVGVSIVLSSSDAVLLIFFLELRVAVLFFVILVDVEGAMDSSTSELSDRFWNNRTPRRGCVRIPVLVVEDFSEIIDVDSGNNVMIVLRRFTSILLLL
jgi:hypothetical protein